ncbi:uncharacterized protein [Panulirus ornatus]|uniref:uncharacterized protein isoform X2 n=1 Tax=Panulirus ornatus TaxID=150431 RepID=UPI003A870B09
MNWVGGVRRRVLLREEEQRQQDRYFAAHASSARKRSRILQGHSSTSGYIGCPGESTDVQHSIEPVPSRPRVGSHHWRNEEMVCERIKRNSASTTNTFQRHNVTETKCPAEVNYRGKNGRSQVGRLDEKNTDRTSGTHLIKLASIHGPFSEFLLKLEMQGIKKKFSNEQLHRSSGGRLPKTLHVGELVEEQMSKRDKMPTKSDWNRHKGWKCIIKDNGKKDKITQWDRRKDDDIRNHTSSSERKEKVKEEKRNEIQKRSKNNKSKLQRTDRDENVAKVNKSEKGESISRNESQQNTINENMKESDIWKFETSTYKNRDNRATWQDDRGNELKEGTFKTDLSPELKCNKRKNITCKTEDSIKRQDLFPSGMKYQKQIIKGENEKVSAREQHGDRHKNDENTKKHESFRQRLTDANYTASGFYEPDKVNLMIKEDKMSTKENMFSGGRIAEQRKKEQTNQFKRTCASTGRTERCTSKQNKSSFGTSDLLTGAPRFRELLTLSPERHKGRIWAPLSLSQGHFVSIDNQKILESSENAVKQGNKNENHSVKGEDIQNLTHHKQQFTIDSKTMKGKENSEWETKRLAMLFGSRLRTSPFVYSSYNNHNPIDEMGNQDTSIHKQSCNKSAESLFDNSHKEEKEDNKTRHIKVNKDNLVCGIQDVDESNGVGVGLRRLGERKLEVIHENDDRIEEKAIQMWQTSGKSKPKLSTFTRKLVKVESGLNFAHKRKDKTPYLDKSFVSPWILSTFINTPSSNKSSQTPSDPTLERLLEDPSGSQDGLELQLHNTSDHMPNISLSFENHEVLQNSVSSSKKSIAQTIKNESYNREVGLSSCSIIDQLHIFKANSDNEKECIFLDTSDNNTYTSESHQILEERCFTTDHKKFKKSPMQDNSQVSTIDYTTCFENNTYSCTISPESSVKTLDRSLLMKHNGEIESDLNSTENKKLLSKSSFQGRDVQHISQKDKSAPLTTGCEIAPVTTGSEIHNNCSYELEDFSTERDTPHIPIITGEMPCTYTSDVNQALVKSRAVVSTGSLDKWTPQLEIHHPQAQREENNSSSTSVNEVKELITVQNLSNGTQKLLIHDSKRGSSCIPCKEVIHGLQVSHSEAG